MWDAARKCIDIATWFNNNEKITGWRKSKAWKRELKRTFRASSKACSSGGKNKEERVHSIVSLYLELGEKLKKKNDDLLHKTEYFSLIAAKKRVELTYYNEMLVKHIDLVHRRLINGEVIPSSEKLYSIFETHSEWLTKGKKFNPVEIGHNVLIATDQFNFIIHHKVLEKQTDSQVTQELATVLIKKFPNLIASLSLDKGFYSKANKEFVQKLIPRPIMPKKGKRNKEETLIEHSPTFIKVRNAHSAVESNINQLEHNGLGRCPDRGIKNFKRYTALSVLAYNLHKLGEHLRKKKVLQKVA